MALLVPVHHPLCCRAGCLGHSGVPRQRLQTQRAGTQPPFSAQVSFVSAHRHTQQALRTNEQTPLPTPHEQALRRWVLCAWPQL